MTEGIAIIDIWNVETFDGELSGNLDAHIDVSRDYLSTSRRQWLERDASGHRIPYLENTFVGEYMRVQEHVMRLMEARTIRAWHYTRLPDAEIDTLREGGIYLSSLDTIRWRLAVRLLIAQLTRLSPMDCSPTVRIRAIRALQDMLKRIGRPRVLKIAMPLVHSRHSYAAAEAVVATYGRMLGSLPDKHAFSLYTDQPLGPTCILAVHSEGEPNFGAMARGYSISFNDTNLGR